MGKHALIQKMEKQHNPEIFELKNPPSIESSFIPASPSAQAPTNPPGLDLASLGGLGVTPEQLLYLQLLQNPLAALGLGGRQVVTRVLRCTKPSQWWRAAFSNSSSAPRSSSPL